MFMLLIYMYLRAPWKIGYNQMGHPRKIKKLLTYLLTARDVNEYSNVRIFAFHTNIRMRFLDSNIRIIF